METGWVVLGWVLMGVVMGASPGGLVKEGKALVVVDPQVCVGSGPFNVSHPEELVGTINLIRSKYNVEWDAIFVSKNWNCPDQSSFITSYPQLNEKSIVLHYNNDNQLCESNLVHTNYTVNCTVDDVMITMAQDLHPPYCVQNTPDTAFLPGFQSTSRDIVITTGDICQVGPYSLFWNDGGFLETSLRMDLISRGIGAVYFIGYGLEDKIMLSAQDATEFGMRVYVVLDASASSDPQNTDYYVGKMLQSGIHIIFEDDIYDSFDYSPQVIADDLLMESYGEADPGKDWDYFYEECKLMGGRICPLDHYCPFGAHSYPFLGFSSVGRWAPLEDQRDWVYLSNNQIHPVCSKYSVTIGSFSSTVPENTNRIPYLCCKGGKDVGSTTKNTDLPVGITWQNSLVVSSILACFVGVLLGVGGFVLVKKVKKDCFVKEKDVNIT